MFRTWLLVAAYFHILCSTGTICRRSSEYLRKGTLNISMTKGLLMCSIPQWPCQHDGFSMLEFCFIDAESFGLGPKMAERRGKPSA